MERTKAERLADYALGLSFKELPAEVVHEAKRRLIDSFACMLGAYDSPPARAAISSAPEVSSKPSSFILGSRQPTTPDHAAFTNGILVRYLDFNDTYLSKEPAHPSDNMAAALSAAAASKKNGSDLLTAIVAAYEVQCRLCDAATLRTRGWDHVAYGAFSATVAASMLLGLSREEFMNAINIAGTISPALRQSRAGELSMWKGCAFANTSRDAIFAALMAKSGITGPAPIFEGVFGFEKTVSGPLELASRFGGEAGERFKILDTYIKFYPAEYHSQSAIGAAIELLDGLEETDEIESVVVRTFGAAYEIIGTGVEKWRPKTRETADHSLPFLVAAALKDGRVNLATYSERMEDDDLIDFVQKIKVVTDADLDSMYPESMPNRVEVTLSSGRMLSREQIYPKGHPKNPMTDRELEEKFGDLGGWYINDVNKALSKLWKAEELSVEEILGIFMR